MRLCRLIDMIYSHYDDDGYPDAVAGSMEELADKLGITVQGVQSAYSRRLERYVKTLEDGDDKWYRVKLQKGETVKRFETLTDAAKFVERSPQVLLMHETRGTKVDGWTVTTQRKRETPDRIWTPQIKAEWTIVTAAVKEGLERKKQRDRKKTLENEFFWRKRR